MSKRYFGSVEIKDEKITDAIEKVTVAKDMLFEAWSELSELLSFTVDSAANTDGGDEAANNQDTDC